jgi:hypothetical protein
VVDDDTNLLLLNNKEIMKVEQILITGAVCALAGGFASALVQTVRNEVHKKQSKLGYDWKYIKMESELMDMVIQLKDYEKYDKDMYFKIGSLLDDMMLLWTDANKEEITKHEIWKFKFFKYKNEWKKNMELFLDSIVKKTSNALTNTGRGKEILTEEFNLLKEQTRVLLEDYYHNMILL